MTTVEIMKKAREASPAIKTAGTGIKNAALLYMADMLIADMDDILKANAADVEAARGKISDVMIDRLSLNEKRIVDMAEGVRQVAALPDPVGAVLSETVRPNGIRIEKISTPMGVIAIIYESRPNVTSDAAALAIKSGSACMLRGGKEAFNSASAIVRALKKGLAKAGLPEDLIGLAEDTTRKSAMEIMTASEYIDLLIPRGGKGLIDACVENAKVPCIETGTGICHVYVDDTADLDMALKIINNAKTSRPSVCNAAEACLVNKAVAEKFLPMLKEELCDRRAEAGLIPVELRLDENAAKIIDGTPAGKDDFDTEFLDYILAVRVVDSVDEAIEHIAAHSTGHSDCIVTRTEANADKFVLKVDSAAVYVNVSTRFTDGGEFGLGCEMGISTQKMHARGPMGLGELTTYKYVIRGNGQVR